MKPNSKSKPADQKEAEPKSDYNVPPNLPRKQFKLVLDEGKNPWEQHEDEPDRLFARFQIYLQLGTERSIVKAYKSLQNKNDSLTAWDSTARRYRWSERANAFDKDISSKMMEKYHESMKNFGNNLVRSLELASKDMVEALEKKDLEFLKKIAPTHMSLIGKGNTASFLLNGHKQLFGEKQQVQQSITVEWDPIEPESTTIDITNGEQIWESTCKKEAKTVSNALAKRKTTGTGEFIELED